ncbi:MAG: dephospho-CoA kinase [Bacteroidaceae bacterium]|nr:dephospho-CoA kinase [Bacteroidaceae bacterium]
MSSRTQYDSVAAGTRRNRRIAVTGGIGSGKSHVCRLIEAAGFPVFYCDDEAKRIMRTDAAVRNALTALIGPECYDACGLPVKSELARYICSGPDNAGRVDAIVHPAVGRAFERWADRQPSGAVFMECALLFEAGFDRYADLSILVSAPIETRERRIMERDGITREKALGWMALQMPEEEKARRAGRILYNGDGDNIARQTELLLADIGSRSAD